ncbi:MAG: hypothetical protein ACTSUE_04715 [Promethearchaeota archaeon]
MKNNKLKEKKRAREFKAGETHVSQDLPDPRGNASILKTFALTLLTPLNSFVDGITNFVWYML